MGCQRGFHIPVSVKSGFVALFIGFVSDGAVIGSGGGLIDRTLNL